MRVSSRAIIIQDGKLLTMFRRRLRDGGKLVEYYVIPGGGQEEGETLEENVKRELKEEMNIDIKVLGFLGKMENENSEQNFFHCEIVKGTPKLGGEELERMTEENYYEPRFVCLDQLDTLDIIGKEFILKAKMLVDKKSNKHMKVFLMRHGTTVWNERGITQGQSQNRLSKRGIEETIQASKKLKKNDIDVIFCSPLMRTVQTAKIMNKQHKKIIKSPLLIEINQGIFTGRKKNSFTEEEKRLRFSRATECGMESYESLAQRCQKFLDYLKTQEYKSVMIITHNVVASMLEDLICCGKIDLKNCSYRKFNNAQIKSFEYQF